jgi:tripartite-type tricarboxylate transporter receptor subunit TctC
MALALQAGLARAALAQERPLRVIVPFGPGGAADNYARLVTQHLGARLGRVVVTDNRPGAGTVIGTAEAARAAPDGNTLLLAPPPFVITQFAYPNLPYDPERDFRPVALIVVTRNALFVRSGLPARSFAEFVALAKSQPGGLTFASPGNGTLPHVAFELLKVRAGIDLLHVPYLRGGTHVDLAAGRIDAMLTGTQELAPFVQAGSVRVLAVAGPGRIGVFPDAPSIQDVGLPGFSAHGWFGFVAPAGVPDAIVARYNAAVREVLAMPEILRRFADFDAVSGSGTPEDFGALLAEERAKWREAVAAAQVRME